MGSDHFPWELLKANCLRLVCSQLITSTEQRSRIWFGKRDEMVSFLHSVHEHGLEFSLKASDSVRAARKPREAQVTSTPSQAKRKGSDVEGADENSNRDSNEDSEMVVSSRTYNTRYKGVKRVKVGKALMESSGSSTPRSRHKTGTTTTSTGASARSGRKAAENVANSSATQRRAEIRRTSLKDDTQASAPKRGRGRPAKSAPASVAVAPNSKGKEVFDGVVLQSRKPNSSSIPDRSASNQDSEEMADLESGLIVEDDAEQIPLAVNGDDSSLGGSNKENEATNNLNHDGGANDDADMDADGDPDADVPPA